MIGIGIAFGMLISMMFIVNDRPDEMVIQKVNQKIGDQYCQSIYDIRPKSSKLLGMACYPSEELRPGLNEPIPFTR